MCTVKALFLHNIRGFEETFIPLEKVNFLVGENGTGKTSVLSILSLISDFDFWDRPSFNTKKISLGTFSDLVNQTSSHSDLFYLGYAVQENPSSKDSDLYLLSFKNENGSPCIKHYSFTLNAKVIHVSVEKQGVAYHIESKTSEEKDLSRLMKALWVAQQRETYSAFIEIEDADSGANLIDIRRKIQEKEALDPAIEILLPAYKPCWMGPIRAHPQRTYEGYKLNVSPDGGYIPQLLNELIADKKRYREFWDAFEQFGRDSGLFDAFTIHRFGESMEMPFEIQVVMDGIPFKISNTGFGLSQILPILVECILRKNESSLMIQQPEVHLHPKAQAVVGNLIFHLSFREDKHFFIETHSNFIIDRYRLCLFRNPKKSRSQILFFERNQGKHSVSPLLLSSQGRYPETQPQSFRDFFIREALELLRI